MPRLDLVPMLHQIDDSIALSFASTSAEVPKMHFTRSLGIFVGGLSQM